MTEPITIIIPGEAVAWGRARLGTVNGHAVHFTPKKTRQHEGYLRTMFALEMAQRGAQATDEAVTMTVIVYRRIPKGASKKKTAAMMAGALLPTTKPDLDNYVKAVVDAANGVIFKDDSQVVAINARKAFDDGQGARTVVTFVVL